METRISKKMKMNLPEGFILVTEEEKRKYFNNTEMDQAFVKKEVGAVIGIVQMQKQLANDKVAEQMAAYQQLYSRMTPGFIMGEMKISDRFGKNVAIMTYKSNAPTRDLFNILLLTTLDEKEVMILFSCDLQDSIKLFSQYIKTINSIEFCEGD